MPTEQESQIQKNTNATEELLGYVLGLGAVLARIPEIGTLDKAEVKRSTRLLTQGVAQSHRVSEATNQMVDAIIQLASSQKRSPSNSD